MNPNKDMFSKLFKWFCSLEEIPLQSRYNLLSHIMEVGTIDKKAIDFIQETLESLEIRYETQVLEYQKFRSTLNNIQEIQASPESLKQRVVTDAEEHMMKIASDFKTDFQAFQKDKYDKAETTENIQDEAQIEALKATVGA